MALVSAALVLRTNRTLSLWAISAGLRGGLSRSFGPVQSLSAFCSALGVLLTFLSTLLLLEPQMWRVHLVQGETGSDVLHQPRCGPASSQTVVSERKGSVVTIGINRPEARNAVNQETAQRLLEEFTAFDGDPDLTVAVLHGIGGNFCAGYDLKELAHQSASLKLEQDVSKGPGPMGPSRLLLSKPLLAAVSGYAVAGGLELALCADIRVVEQSAVMGVFCRRFGVPLIDGGTVRLPCLIGLSRALDLILTGRPIGAQEALAFGLANRVVPDGQALQAALELAEQISNFPQRCLRADRASAYHSALEAPSFREAMQYEFDHSVAVLQLESVAGAARFSSGTGRGGAFPTGSTHDNTRAK